MAVRKYAQHDKSELGAMARARSGEEIAALGVAASGRGDD